MSTKKRWLRGKNRKRLAYLLIAVVFVFIVVYSSLDSLGQTDLPKAADVAIVDHLSFFSDQRNQTFVDACIEILEEDGLTWAYHKGADVTVNFYRNLPSSGTRFIILRVHSAIMRIAEGETIPLLALFTSERYLGIEDAHRRYPIDIENDRLVRAFFEEGGKEYFGIVPEFVEKSMKGEFENTTIIMMGCQGLGYDGQAYTDMAKAFVKKGAKVYISWNGLVSINHTDQATTRLLKSLILEKQTIEGAVEGISPDSAYNSRLSFYPTGAGSDRIINPASSSISTANIIETNAVYTKSRYLQVKLLISSRHRTRTYNSTNLLKCE